MTELQTYLTATICSTRYLIIGWWLATVILAYTIGRRK